jgi:hypothetical protein
MFTELTLADIEAEWDTSVFDERDVFPAEEPPTVRRPLTPDEMAALLRDALAG